MNLLATNIPPLESSHKSYSDVFIQSFFDAHQVLMVAGYVAGDAIFELRSLIDNHSLLRSFDLIVGMAKFDGLRESQIDALTSLDEVLKSRNLGQVHLAVALPIHAKASCFSLNQNPVSAIVGSSNLSGLIQAFRQFELDVFTNNEGFAKNLHQILVRARDKASRPFVDSIGGVRILENPNLVLEGVPSVQRVSTSELESKKTDLSFELLIKPEGKSHLNACFGKGRLQNGHVIPRPWYEVELIIGVDTTRLPGYPQTGTSEANFEVITDDGWRFACQVQGGNSKNFRSKDDLKTLGKWIKERLQNAGALKIGDPVTAQTLDQYGRNTLTFTKLNEENLWYLDFSRPRS